MNFVTRLWHHRAAPPNHDAFGLASQLITLAGCVWRFCFKVVLITTLGAALFLLLTTLISLGEWLGEVHTALGAAVGALIVLIYAGLPLCGAAYLVARRRFHFGLKTLLLTVTAAALLLGVQADNLYRRSQRWRACHTIEQLGGRVHSYRVRHWADPSPFFDNNAEPSSSDWLLLGLDNSWFNRIMLVHFLPQHFEDDHLLHLKILRDLEQLDLRNTGATDAGLEHLKELGNLRYLCLARTQIHGEGLRHLGGCRKIEKLDLGYTQVSDEGLQHLETLANLRVLILNGTQITGAGLAHLAGLANLEKLHLSNTEVGDAGLEYIRGLTNLRSLYLDHTQVTDAGLRYIEGLRNLEHFGFHQTAVTKARVQELRAVLPWVKVEYEGANNSTGLFSSAGGG